MLALQLSVKKSEYFAANLNEVGSTDVNGTTFIQRTNFKYPESAIALDVGLMFVLNSCLSAVWSR